MISATRSFALAACGTFLASLCGTAPLRGSDKEGLTPGLLQDPPPAAPSAPAAGPVKLTTTQVALAVAQAKSRLQWDKLERMQRQLERLELNRDLYWNANYRSIVAMQMKKLRDECQGVRQGLVTLENRIRSLESASRSGSAPSPGHLAAAPRERAEQLGAGLESKADSPSGPSHRDDPFFFVTRQSVSGEIRRQKVKTNLVSGKAIPTQLVRGHQGGIGFVNAELREWGMLHPDADRTGAKFFRSKDHLKSYDVCSDQRNTYFAYLTPHGTVIGGIDVRRTCPDLFLVNKDFKDEPLGLVSFSNMLYLIGANQMLVMSHRADESGAEAQLYHRVQGSPFLPGTRFLVVDEHLHFCEPGGATYGRVRERLFSRSAGFTIERFQLPKGAKATAMALAPGPADGKAGHGDLLCITDADHDSIHQIDPADMQVKRTIHLVPGTRPGDLAEGPRGTLIFATARGFGCLTAAGEARQVKLHGNPKVRPAGLVSVPEQGKVYFLDRPQPGIAVLNLFALDGKGSAGPNGEPAYTCGEALDGPTLRGEESKATTEAQTERKRNKRKKSRNLAAGAPSRPEPAAPPSMASSAPAAPAGLGLESAPAEDADAEEDRDASDDEDAGAAEEGKADGAPEERGLLFYRNISQERYTHVLDHHTFSLEPVLDPSGRIKSQFSEDCTASRLNTFRQFKKFVCSVLRSGQCTRRTFTETEDGSALVLEFAWTGEVGRVHRSANGTWAATSSLRLALGLNDDGEFFLLSFYPIRGSAPAA